MRIASRMMAAMIACLTAASAYAHDIEDYDIEAYQVLPPLGGFLEGVFHPVYGPDHLLAMLSVGMLSAQMGGSAIWRVPAMFVAAMVVGGVAGLSGITVAVIEPGIATSVMVLGLALLLQTRLRVAWVLLFVAFFGVLHGYAHGIEMPRIAEPLWYSLGFVTSTAVIHIIGLAFGFIFTRTRAGAALLRVAGAVIAGTGSYFLAAGLHA